MRRSLGLAFALALLVAAPAAAAPRLESLGSFATPVGIAAPPGDASRVMVVEKGGTVRMLRDGVKVAQPFLDVSSITSSSAEEQGLLSIAFPPDYQQTGLFYVFLNAKDAAATSGEGEVQIREFHRADADHAAAGTGRVVLAVPHSAPNHNGGQLQFTPDGLLWFTIGDNANSANAQNTGNLYGKISRIDPRASGGQQYTVPAGNPFPGNPVWAYGLRNPWRFSFDRQTGDLLIGDVGEVTYEEIDFAPHTADPATSLGRGANYGWPCREGLHPGPDSCTASPRVDPVVEHTHADGWNAIIGGYVVRDAGLPTLAGRYLYGDYVHSAMHALTPTTKADGEAGLDSDSLTALGEDACGRLYAASHNGPVSRIVDGTPSPCSFPPPAGPGGGSPPPAADTTPCTVRLTAGGTRLVTVRRYLRLTVRSSEACRLTITGRVPGKVKFRTLRRSVAAHRTVALKLRLTRAANRKLARAVRGRRSATVRLRLRSVDAAGNERVLSRRVRVRH
jgi:glucose/arabinose dehydrogenase